MYEQHLQLTGLTGDQAIVYETLLREGALRASVLARKTPLKRGLAYKVLESLVALELVEKMKQQGDVATFSAKHPSLLGALVERRERAVTEARASVETIMPSLVSAYNLVSGMPGVRFYEGMEGVERVLRESLEAQGMIRTYVDHDAVEQYVHDINASYVRERIRRNIPKRLLVLDSPHARETFYGKDEARTDVKFIRQAPHILQSSLQVYDDTIAYIALDRDRMIGVIFESPSIAALHTHLFDCLWDLTPPLGAPQEELPASYTPPPDHA